MQCKWSYNAPHLNPISLLITSDISISFPVAELSQHQVHVIHIMHPTITKTIKLSMTPVPKAIPGSIVTVAPKVAQINDILVRKSYR